MAAVILSVTPRTSLPPEADDPLRPKNIRMAGPSPTIRHPYAGGGEEIDRYVRFDTTVH